MTRYRNIWHKPNHPEYGPPVYETDATPSEYRGHLIYRRTAQVWDVVKGDECVGQYAGPNGARQFVDKLAGYSA